jgi:Ran GTPase-activating protein (RanGAP) involved in mRNA processing and transport
MSPAEAFSRACADAGIDAEPVVAAALAEMSGRLDLSGVVLVRASTSTSKQMNCCASLLSHCADPNAQRRPTQHTVLLAELTRCPSRMQSETQALCLAQALRSANGIRVVEFKDVPLSPTAAARLSEALAALESVDHLFLANVALGDDGAEAMLARTPYVAHFY